MRKASLKVTNEKYGWGYPCQFHDYTLISLDYAYPFEGNDKLDEALDLFFERNGAGKTARFELNMYNTHMVLVSSTVALCKDGKVTSNIGSTVKISAQEDVIHRIIERCKKEGIEWEVPFDGLYWGLLIEKTEKENACTSD